jgi:hypothetical protein
MTRGVRICFLISLRTLGGGFVPAALDQNIKLNPVLIDSPPEAVLRSADRDHESSGPGELHPQALTDPDVSVSTHPAPTVQPVPGIAMANAQKGLAPDA